MTKSNQEKKIIYWLDKDMRITAVSGPWDEFAIENNGRNVVEPDVKGRPIWHFIKGNTTRMWVDTLIKLAMVTGKVVERPYRCDSPEMKRYMSMKIVPEESGAFRMEHTVLFTEKRSHNVHFNYSENQTLQLKQRCSSCGRLRTQDSWEEAEYLSPPGEGTLEKTYTVIYTMCPDCLENISKRRFYGQAADKAK